MTTLYQKQDDGKIATFDGDSKEFLSFVDELPQGTAYTPPTEAAGPSGGDIAKGLAAEIAIGAGAQVAGAATGIGYLPIAFAGGVAGNIAAQEIEGAEGISWGRALVAGAANLIPASKALQGIGKGTVITKQLIAEAAKDQAFKGAVIGVSDTTARATIDEDRMPTPQELLTGGLAGATFGGVLGGVSPKVSKSISGMFASKVGKKIEGKTPAEIDELVKKGVITREELSELTDMPLKDVAKKTVLADEAKEVAEAEELLRKESGGLNWFQKTFAKWTPSITLGKEVQNLIIKHSNLTTGNIAAASRIERSVSTAIEKNPTLLPSVNQYLDTGVMDSSLKGTLLETDLKFYDKLRSESQLSLIDQLDENSFLKMTREETQALSKIVQDSYKNKNYNTREYKMFTDSKYEPSAQQRAAAVEEIAEKEMLKGNVKRAEATEIATKKVQSLLDSSAFARSVSGDNKNKALEGVFRKRADVGEAEREFLGEITEPGERIRGTLSSLTRIVERNSGDIAIAKTLEKAGLATAEKGAPAHWIPLVVRGNLDTGLHVPPAINQALIKDYLTKEQRPANELLDMIQDFWFAGTGAAKATKVLFNPSSYGVNAYGGMATMLGMGVVPNRAYFKGLKLALSEFNIVEDLASGGSPAARKAMLTDMRDMERFGLSNANILVSDVRDTLDAGKISTALSDKLTPVGKVYSATDTAARYQVWVHNRAVVGKLFPDMDSEGIKQRAADLTNDTFQNYARLNDSAKTLSRIGVMPQFASFTLEFARNITNQVKVSKQMMMGTFGKELGITNQPNIAAMKLEGAKRMASLTAVVGATEAGRRAWNEEQGVTEDKEKLLTNLVVAPWDKGKSLSFKMSEDGKTGEYMNLSYLSPHAMIADLINAGLGEDPAGDIAEGLSEYFIGEGSFLLQEASRGLANRDEYGRTISNSPDKLVNARKRVAHTLYEILEPGVFREFERGLDPEFTREEMALRLVGIRNNKFNIEERSVQTVRSNIFAGRDSFRAYNSMRNKGDDSPQAMAKAYEEASADYTANMKNTLENIGSMRALGYDQDKIIGILKEAGTKGSDILSLLEGRINIPAPDKEPTTADIFTELGLDTATPKEFSKKVGEVFKTDANLAKALRDRYVANRKAKVRGVSAYDTVVKGLSLEERAEYAIKTIGNNPKVLNELFKKGIVTKGVMIKMREMGYNSKGNYK